MSTCKSIADTINQIQNWLRLATFLHGPLKESLLFVLHNTSNQNYVGLPTDPTDLYQELTNKHKGKITKLVKGKNKVLNQKQFDLLFPPGDTKTYSEEFDVTLIVVLIRNCTTLPAPQNGWGDKNPPNNDQSITENAIRAREWRNYLFHHPNPETIDANEYNQLWANAVNIIKAIKYSYNTKKLKKISLDPKHQLVLKSLYILGKTSPTDSR